MPKKYIFCIDLYYNSAEAICKHIEELIRQIGSPAIRFEDIFIYFFTNQPLVCKAIIPIFSNFGKEGWSKLTAVELTLDIPDIAVKQMISGLNGIIIEVESLVTGAVCHKCGRHIFKPFNKGREVDLRRSTVFGKPVFIRIAPPRCQCTDCSGQPTSTQAASWYTPGSPFTLAYENQILLGLINSTVEDTALKEGIGYEAVMGVLKRRVSTRADWKTIDKTDFIGLDEISLKKGHKDFVTVVSALSGDDLTVLAILEGRKKTVKKFLKTIPKKIKKN